MAATALFESRNESLRVRDHEELRMLRRTRDQPAERGKELRVQARLRLVEHEELRRGRPEERPPPHDGGHRAPREPRPPPRPPAAGPGPLPPPAPLLVRGRDPPP